MTSVFELVREIPVASLAVTVQEFRHPGTGARHFHLDSADTNNVFLVAFPTVPEDSTGVAHILEHTTLCGSQRYPVRDPFFMMIRRSLNTFMNAFTSSDATLYPFASQNRKDFDNLLAVYLDAVFFPNLDPLDFAQEGHRLESETADDPETPLTFRGVVYNEMKGAMSSPVARLWQDLYAELFPTTTYRFNSGGEPDDIPRLTHAQLKAFHRSHYHPSQAIFMTYGCFPVQEHQAKMQELALGRFTERREDFRIPDERRFDAPRIAATTYATDDADVRDKSHVVMAWLLGRCFELPTLMESSLLSGVLLDTGASPLRRALETSTLGSAPSELCGLDDSTREMVFMCGLEGSNPDSAEAVEALILECLTAVARDGVDPELVQGVLERFELGQRDIQGGGQPYGLHLLSRMLPPALHGGDVAGFLNIDPVLEKLREQVRDADFIPGLARRWLLDNPHRVRLTMRPDPRKQGRAAAALSRELARRKAQLQPSELRQLAATADALSERQRQVDDPGLLPKVGLADVPAKIVRPRPALVAQRPAALTWFDQGTNGVTHQQVVVPLPVMDEEEITLLPVYSSVLLELGCGDRDYLAMQVRQSALGSLSASTLVRADPEATTRLRGFLLLSGKSLSRHQQAMAELMLEIMEGARFDEQPRLRELIAQIRAAEEADITGHGHVLAMIAASATFGVMGPLLNRWHGPDSIGTIKRLDDALDASSDACERLGEALAGLHAKLARMPRQLLLVCEGAQRDPLVDGLGGIWRRHGALRNGLPEFSGQPVPGSVSAAWTTSTQVNFCARAYSAVPNRHPDAPALAVLGKLLHNGFLHSAVREQGGAYGSGANYDPETGSFKFFSYRDPRLADTLRDFDRALDWMAEVRDGRLLEEAILGVIRGLDQPDTPAGEAIRAFHGNLHGRTDEFLQWFRNGVLGLRLEDVRAAAERYLIPGTANTAVLTNAAQRQVVEQLGLAVHAL